MAASRRWTLDEDLGYTVCTGIPQPQIGLELRLQRRSGAIDGVGAFDLDLVALSRRGVVTCRRTSKGEVFDVKIVRDADGTFHLTVRQSQRIPLAPFRRVR